MGWPRAAFECARNSRRRNSGIEGGRGSDRVRRDGIDTGRDWEREREEIMVVVWMEG
jgi:hypothetical protein